MGRAATTTAVRQKTALADAISGVMGALVALWAFYPMDVIKTNMQASTTTPAASLVRGLPAKTLHTAASSFCYFYIDSYIVSWWTITQTHTHNRQISTISKLLLSAVAAMLNTSITLPLDVIASRHQTSALTLECKDVREQDEARDVDSSMNEQGKKENQLRDLTIQGDSIDKGSLWKGLWPSLLLCINPSIHYTVFDVLKSRRLKYTNKALSMREAFAIGLLSKFLATIATYPLIRAKVMLMVTSKNTTSLFTCIKEEYQRNGLVALYKGCNLQLLHTVLKSALMMMVREWINKTTHRMLVPSSSLSPATGKQIES